jgi:hypothetical protein
MAKKSGKGPNGRRDAPARQQGRAQASQVRNKRDYLPKAPILLNKH